MKARSLCCAGNPYLWQRPYGCVVEGDFASGQTYSWGNPNYYGGLWLVMMPTVPWLLPRTFLAAEQVSPRAI